MGLSWDSHGIGIPKGIPWGFHGTSMPLPWVFSVGADSHGIPVVAQGSHDILRGLPLLVSGESPLIGLLLLDSHEMPTKGAPKHPQKK